MSIITSVYCVVIPISLSSCGVLYLLSQKYMLQLLLLQIVTLFENEFSAEVMILKWGISGWIIIFHFWCSIGRILWRKANVHRVNIGEFIQGEHGPDIGLSTPGSKTHESPTSLLEPFPTLIPWFQTSRLRRCEMII